MTAARIFPVVLGVLAIGGCAQPPKPPPAPVYSERIILLPSRDGRPSGVVVKRATGEQSLDQPYQAAELTSGADVPRQYAAAEVEQRYGTLLEVQPARPVTYMLFFNTGTAELTPQSRKYLGEVRERIADFPAAQVTVIGHTDRVGTPEANDALSFKRAAAVRDLLTRIGIPNEAIEVVGRGEREPLVPTPDGKAEERNRRVEIRLR